MIQQLLAKRYALKEAQRANDPVQRPPGDTLRGKGNLKGPYVFQSEPVGRTAEIPAEPRDRVEDRCVAGDRLQIVMSSIIRRRTGLISAI